MIDNSSSDDDTIDAEELAQKFDWSSPRRRKKNLPAKEEVDAKPIDGLCNCIRT